MRIVITGATGFLGVPLSRALVEAGHTVVALTRNPAAAQRRLPAGVAAVGWTAMPGDAATQRAIAEADAIVNLAGEPIGDGRWTPTVKERIRRSRIDATRAVVEAIRSAPSRPRVLIQASGQGVYGCRGDEVLTETSGPGHDFLARVVIDWEAEARPAENLGVRVVYLRSGLVLAADGGALGKMLLPSRFGLGGPIGDGRQWWSWIHRADWVELVLFALAREDVRGPLNATAPQPVQQAAFARALGQTLHRPAFLPLPTFALRLAFGEKAETLLCSARVLPKAAQSAGYTFQYPKVLPALRDVLGQRE